MYSRDQDTLKEGPVYSWKHYDGLIRKLSVNITSESLSTSQVIKSLSTFRVIKSQVIKSLFTSQGTKVSKA